MPDFTPNFNLPFPSPTDAPCEFAEQWCDFTDAINAVISNFQLGADRAIPVIPAAILRASVARPVINGQLVPFDEVVLDTAGMTNLDSDPYRITITRPGQYTVAGFIDKNTSGIVNVQTTMFMSSELAPLVGDQGMDVDSNILDRGAGLVYDMTAYGTSQGLRAGDRIGVFFNTGIATAQTVNNAWISVIWHADTEVP